VEKSEDLICHWKPGLSGGFEGFHCWK